MVVVGFIPTEWSLTNSHNSNLWLQNKDAAWKTPREKKREGYQHQGRGGLLLLKSHLGPVRGPTNNCLAHEIIFCHSYTSLHPHSTADSFLFLSSFPYRHFKNKSIQIFEPKFPPCFSLDLVNFSPHSTSQHLEYTKAKNNLMETS